MTVRELVDRLRVYPGDATVEVTIRSPQMVRCFIHPVLEVEGDAYENVFVRQVVIRLLVSEAAI